MPKDTEEMATAARQPVKRRRTRHAVYGTLIVVLFVCAAWYLTSDNFRELIRNRLIAQLEDATGGQVEIGRVDWNIARLRVAIEGLTIHGLESPSDPPLLHVRSVDARLRIVSLLARQVSFRYLEIADPSLNLIVYPDGRTNQPAPRTRHKGGQRGALDPVFDLAIRQLSITNGVLRINEQKTRFEFRGNDVAVRVHYESAPECYAGNVKVGKFDTHWADRRPFASALNFDFRLFRNALELRSAQLTSERSELSFDGTLTNFSAPQVGVNYQSKVDLRQFGSVTRVTEFQGGTVQLAGNARLLKGEWTADGNIQLTDAAWNQPAVHAGGISGNASFHLDRDRLQLSHLSASALGGNISGEMTVMYWNAPPRSDQARNATTSRPAKGHVVEAREQSAGAKFELRNLQVERIAAMFSTPHLPLDTLHAAGATDGRAELTWSGAPKYSELRLDLRAMPNGSMTQGQMPVSAHVEATYSFRDEVLEMDQAELQTPATHLTATGSLGISQVDLGIGFSTSSFHETRPLLAVMGIDASPVRLEGEGSFQGTVSGRTVLPTINGHLRLSEFTTIIQPRAETEREPELVKALHRKSKPLPAPPTAAQPPVQFHWDSFDGYIVYSPDTASLRGAVLRAGSARFEIAANTSLERGTFTDQSIFRGTLRIRDADVHDIQTLLSLNYPVAGTLNVEAQVEGTRIDPKGSGTLSIKNGTAYGEPLESLTTDLTFSGREARFSNLHAVSAGAHAEGSGFINVSSEQFQFDIQGAGVDLLRFPDIQTERVKLTGSASFNAKARGTLSAPIIDGHAHINKISLGAKAEGDLDIDAKTNGDVMELTAQSHFVSATLSASGKVHLRGDLTSEINAQFGNVDLQPFLVGIARGHSSIDGNLHSSGPLGYPSKLNARLEITSYKSEVEGVELHNSGPIVATYQDGTATLEAFRLQGEGTDLSSSGTARLVDGQELRMRADGRLNLKLLQSFNPEVVSYGQTTIGVQVGGTLHDPSLRGRINIDHAGISYVDLPNGLSDLNGSFIFNENRLQVEKLTAHTGGGDLAIGGFIAYGRAVSFNLSATGKDIRIRYPEGVSANGDANLRLAGTLQNATLSGEVVINKFGLNPRFDFANYLTQSKQLSTTPNPDSPLNSLHFDVRVVSTPELKLETSLARITGDVDLRLRGTASRPVVLGRISIVEGDITFNGTKYRLDRGDVLFSNPTKIEPVLDLEASARVSTYDISIGLHGTADKLNTTYRSDPPLPTSDVFALLAFGHTNNEMGTGATQSNAFTQTASSAVLGSALNAAVSSRVQKLFGASRIKIDPQVGGAENNPNARLTVEQQVSGNITLTYITNLAQSAQQVIQFEYNVNRNVSIVGVRDEYGVVGFEVQIRQRRR